MSLPQADKKLGQHFLTDKNVIEKICNDDLLDNDAIFEVGPGPGILTEFLSQKKSPLFLFEKDERFPELLEKFVSNENIFLGDALEVNFENFANEKEIKNVWLVSNLPYNVSVPLTINFIKAPAIKKMTLMFQKEVALKALNFNQSKNAMGSLMALTQNYFNVSLLTKVAPGAFSPPPKIESTVLSFERIIDPVISLDEFDHYENFLRLCFSQKRKQLSKVLSQRFDRNVVNSHLDGLGVSTTIRAEALSLDQIRTLYRKLNEENS